jgi:hypothetical protein
MQKRAKKVSRTKNGKAATPNRTALAKGLLDLPG